jgi:hypothetical protein
VAACSAGCCLLLVLRLAVAGRGCGRPAVLPTLAYHRHHDATAGGHGERTGGVRGLGGGRPRGRAVRGGRRSPWHRCRPGAAHAPHGGDTPFGGGRAARPLLGRVLLPRGGQLLQALAAAAGWADLRGDAVGWLDGLRGRVARQAGAATQPGGERTRALRPLPAAARPSWCWRRGCAWMPAKACACACVGGQVWAGVPSACGALGLCAHTLLLRSVRAASLASARNGPTLFPCPRSTGRRCLVPVATSVVWVALGWRLEEAPPPPRGEHGERFRQLKEPPSRARRRRRRRSCATSRWARG